MSELENAFNNAIVQEGVENITRTRMWAAWGDDGNNNVAFVGQLGAFLVISSHGADARSFYTSSPGRLGADGQRVETDDILDTLSNGYRISLKNGAAIFIVRQNQLAGAQAIEAIRNAGGSMLGNCATVYIDVNGNATPNTVGRDLFRFAVGPNGMLYPAGGTDMAAYANSFPGNNVGVWSQAGSADSCVTGSIGSPGWGCTARVIAEGYQMNY